jgi:hypothetical protein
MTSTIWIGCSPWEYFLTAVKSCAHAARRRREQQLEVDLETTILLLLVHTEQSTHTPEVIDFAMSNFQLPPGFRPSGPPSQSSQPQAGPSQGGNGEEEQAAQRERQHAAQEMKRNMIAAMLEPAARERRAYDHFGRMCLLRLILDGCSVPYRTHKAATGRTGRGSTCQNGSAGTDTRSSHGRSAQRVVGSGKSHRRSVSVTADLVPGVEASANESPRAQYIGNEDEESRSRDHGKYQLVRALPL